MNKLTVLLAACVVLTAPAWSQAAPEARVIVAFKPGAAALRDAAAGGDMQVLQRRANALAQRAGRPLLAGRALGQRQQVLRAVGTDSDTLAARLAADPDVAWAVPDRRRRATTVPTDPLYPVASRASGPDAGQWYLRAPDPVTYKSAVNAEAAWTTTLGRADIVVAVIDTGVRPDHPDLAGRLLPGIDAISADTGGGFATANDGDGEDTDPSDPGDWITAAENRSGPFTGCGGPNDVPSSWHGTQVATILGAATGDGIGMTGTAPQVGILPVRVLGKCGGYDSDIIAGMLWAAGLQTVAGIVNANPAQVLNLSLGGVGSCTAAYIDAVQRINATGAVVVAAAGNDAGRAVGTPANCPGVIGVGGLRHAGTKVGFSDLGPEIAISAPGGNCVNIGLGERCLYPILAGANSGATAPVVGGSIWTDSYDFSVGTSFSSPIVAGVAALVLSVRDTLTPEQLRTVLQFSARPFPTTGGTNSPGEPDPVACRPPDGTDQLQCYCSTDLCGAGMLDADGAVRSGLAGFARPLLTTAAPVAGSVVVLDGSSSLAPPGRSIAAYAWSLVSGGGVVGTLSGNAASVSFMPTAGGTAVVRLTVTDDLGGQLATDRSINVAAAPVEPKSSGGGAVGPGWLLSLLAAVGLLRRVR